MLYNCHFIGFAEGKIYKGKGKNMCVPGLNCYSCPGAIGACPMGSLQSALVSSGYSIPYYVLGILLLMGVLLGRFVCGFLCPFGLLQEVLYKLPCRKVRKNRATQILSYGKYVVLLVLAVILPIGFQLPGFCKFLCPVGTLEGGILLGILNRTVREMLGKLFTWKMMILIVLLVSAVFCYRSFCRFLCPLGAFYSLFNRFSLVRMVVDEEKCNRCGACSRFCKMDIARVGDRECIQCGECTGVCAACAIGRSPKGKRQQEGVGE